MLLIGIRIALGARRSKVVQQVVGQSVALILFGVAVIASVVPAITASRVDPMDALREE